MKKLILFLLFGLFLMALPPQESTASNGDFEKVEMAEVVLDIQYQETSDCFYANDPPGTHFSQGPKFETYSFNVVSQVPKIETYYSNVASQSAEIPINGNRHFIANGNSYWQTDLNNKYLKVAGTDRMQGKGFEYTT